MRDKTKKNGVNQSFLGRAMQSAFTVCHGGNLRANLAYLVNYCRTNQRFIHRRRDWYQLNDPGEMEDLICLDGKSEPGSWTRVHATADRPPSLTAPRHEEQIYSQIASTISRWSKMCGASCRKTYYSRALSIILRQTCCWKWISSKEQLKVGISFLKTQHAEDTFICIQIVVQTVPGTNVALSYL